MKAYLCWFDGEEWVDYFHAESENSARIQFWNAWSQNVGALTVYIDVRAKRIPELDSKVLHGLNIEQSGNDEWPPEYDASCACDLCKGKVPA